jgi:catechol 2,3-dioxygenase-like lactoylglutathione lyase family enzyme
MQENAVMDMRLGHIELFVDDARRSVDFYTGILGFGVVADQGKTIWLEKDGITILLRPGAGPTGTDPSSARHYNNASSGIVIYTSDLPETMRALEERGLAFQGDDGPGCPTFTDPDGHWFQLVDPSSH